MRSGDCEHFRVRRANERAALFRSKAAGNDDLAVLGQRLADGR
jgi:hypothetical protein